MTGTDAARQLIRPERTQLVVVDMQEKLLPSIAAHDEVLRNCVLLLRLAEVLGLPVVVTTQYEKGLGPTVAPILDAARGARPVDKTTFGCFGAAPFLETLRARSERDQLLVCGIETHICVTQTVLGALAAGHVVHVAADAVGSRAPGNRVVGLARMEGAGAVVTSAEMAVYELLGRSDGAAFKAMLPWLKEASR